MYSIGIWILMLDVAIISLVLQHKGQTRLKYGDVMCKLRDRTHETGISPVVVLWAHSNNQGFKQQRVDVRVRHDPSTSTSTSTST